MRILFAGTPEIAVPALMHIAAKFEVCGVLTNPDRIRARGKKVLPSPVKAAAVELGLPVLQPERLLRESREQAAQLKPDLLVTFAYGRIFGPRFLSLFPLGGVNVHPSLLPQLRGSSPIQSAILLGLPVTGITIQQIALETDSGRILMQQPVELDGKETTESLTQYMAGKGAELLEVVLHNFEQGDFSSREQDHSQAVYCTKLEKDDRFIQWTKSGSQLSREVRAFYPWPKSSAVFNGRQLVIAYALPLTDEDMGIIPGRRPLPGTVLDGLQLDGIPVVCGEGGLLLLRLQLAAKKELDWKSFRNGNPEIMKAVLT